MNKYISVVFLILSIIHFQSNAQSMKIYANGGCVMMIDAASTIKSCDKEFRFQTNEANSTVTISTANRTFANYTYTQVKKADGTNLGSSLADLLVKLGEIQASVSGSSGGGSGGEVVITPIDNTFSCPPAITSVTVYAANTYKEITISPRDGGAYTLQTGSNTAVTGITTGRYFSSSTGLIATIITVTPTGGSSVDVCTKQ